MSPPAHSSHPPPDPVVLPSLAPTPRVSQLELFFDFLCQGVAYGVKGGIVLGAFYGMLLGSLLFPVIGTIFGLGYGVVIGLIFGAVAGFIGGGALGLLTLLCFVPLGSVRSYRWTIGLFGTLVTAVLGLFADLLYAPGSAVPFGSAPVLTADTLSFGLIPVLIAVGYAWWATGQLAHRYAQSAASRTVWPRRVRRAHTARNIYHPDFLRQLFDEMQSTYELVCHVSSFGFNRRWRRQLLGLLDLRPGMRVCDAMCGTGETWVYILPRIGPTGGLTAVDFSSAMALRARERRRTLPGGAVEVLEEDALQMSLPSGSMDALVCVYGVKTLSNADQERFVREIRRVLKVGGAFGLVEISAPSGGLLRAAYLFYLRYVVPPIGWLFLGNPENYRLLSRYVADFGNCKRLRGLFVAASFAVHEYAFFGGCATALVGMKLDER